MYLIKTSKNYYIAEGKVGNMKNQKIIIDLKNIDFHGTIHSAERQIRKDNLGGKDISIDELSSAIEKAIVAIISDFANGEISNNTRFLIYDKKTNINIVGVLKMQKGKDFLTIITVMRKKDFKIDKDMKRYDV